MKNYCWEIFDGKLCIFNFGVLPDLTIVDDFIRNLQPANAPKSRIIASIIKAKEVFRTYGGKLVCQVCNSKLSLGKNWLACGQGHGYLMTGSQLVNTRLDSASLAKQLSAALGRAPRTYTRVTPSKHSEIKCPNCQNMMTARNYQNTGIVIDVCTACAYRWLDGVELNSVLGQYRHE